MDIRVEGKVNGVLTDEDENEIIIVAKSQKASISSSVRCYKSVVFVILPVVL